MEVQDDPAVLVLSPDNVDAAEVSLTTTQAVSTSAAPTTIDPIHRAGRTMDGTGTLLAGLPGEGPCCVSRSLGPLKRQSSLRVGTQGRFDCPITR